MNDFSLSIRGKILVMHHCTKSTDANFIISLRGSDLSRL
jgi:hypothetical protein